MNKNLVFTHAGINPDFAFTNENVECLTIVRSLESIRRKREIDVKELFSMFNIPYSQLKITKENIFYRTCAEAEYYLNKYSKAIEILNEFQDLSLEELYLKFSEIIKSEIYDELKIAALLDCIDSALKTKRTNVPERIFKLIFRTKVYDKAVLNDCKLLFNEKFYYLSLNVFFPSKPFSDILFLSNLMNFEDLHKANIDLLFPLFIDKFESLVAVLKSFDENIFESFEKETDLLVDFLSKKERRLDIFQRRNSIGYSKKQTLEEIGDIYGVTRERIRQIDVSTIALILNRKNNLDKIINVLLLSLLAEKDYVEKGQIIDCFSNAIYSDYLSVFVNIFDTSEFEYNEEVGAFLKKGNTENIKDDIVAAYPTSITIDEFNHLDSTRKKIVPSIYNLSKNNIYIKKGISFSEFALIAFDECFPNGGRITEGNCSILCDYLKTKYGVEFECKPHNLQTYFERHDYCSIDRGTYINRKYAAIITENLMDKITKYVLSQEGVVYYDAIFNVFKEELCALGITNWYYVKGVIDKKFPSGIRTKRDYCCKQSFDGDTSSFYENFFEKKKGIVKLADFLNENPGTKDYMLFNYVSSVPQILWLSNKTFVDVKLLTISQSFKKNLENELRTLFLQLNTDVITDSKIYSRFKILYNEELSKLPFIQNEFDFYSLAKYLVGDEFFFSRPFISNNKESLTYLDVMLNYINSLNRYDYKTIQSYCLKMHLRLYNYLNLLISTSEHFVQISCDCSIKKEVFDISESDLDKIKNDLLFYIDSFGEADLSKFNGYAVFPRLRYMWNKYLLVGIIRCYYPDLFEIEYTAPTYDKTDFIIRRKTI